MYGSSLVRAPDVMGMRLKCIRRLACNVGSIARERLAIFLEKRAMANVSGQDVQSFMYGEGDTPYTCLKRREK